MRIQTLLFELPNKRKSQDISSEKCKTVFQKIIFIKRVCKNRGSIAVNIKQCFAL